MIVAFIGLPIAKRQAGRNDAVGLWLHDEVQIVIYLDREAELIIRSGRVASAKRLAVLDEVCQPE